MTQPRLNTKALLKYGYTGAGPQCNFVLPDKTITCVVEAWIPRLFRIDFVLFRYF